MRATGITSDHTGAAGACLSEFENRFGIRDYNLQRSSYRSPSTPISRLKVWLNIIVNRGTREVQMGTAEHICAEIF